MPRAPLARAAADPVVAAAGDIACDPGDPNFNNGNGTSSSCRQKHTAARLSGATAVLPLGDLQYEDATHAKFLQSYDRSWGAYKAITYPALGNHEYLTPGAAGYFQYFASHPLAATRSYYSFDLGNWHLIALNSTCSQIGGCGAGSAQEQWLRADLAATRQSCILAYWHHPRFSSGTHGSSQAYDAFWRALYAARADVVLVGHDHSYERFALQNPDGQADPLGIRQFVVGTGGRSLRPFGIVQPNSELRNATAYGVLKLTLHANSYDWQFVPDGRQGVLDAGSTACHPGTPTAVAVAGFRAARTARGVHVQWTAQIDSRTLGFNLFREQAGRRVRLNRALISTRNASTAGRYSWLDRTVSSRSSVYRLQAVAPDRAVSWAARAAVPPA